MLSDFKRTVDEMYAIKKDRDAYEAKSKELTERLEAIKQTIIAHLQENELDSFESTECKIYLSNKSSVKVPRDPEKKKLLFDFIRSKYGPNVLMNMVTVNSMSFNSFYNEEEKHMLESGQIEFSMPGVDQPATYTTLNIRKK